MNIRLFVIQRKHGILFGGAGGGSGAEDDADDHGRAHGDEDGEWRDGDLEIRKLANAEGQRQPDDGADGAADGADDHGFHKKLNLNVTPRGADGLADSDLADALTHVGEHDVHDADSADDEGDHGDEQKHDGERVGGLAGNLHQLREIADRVRRFRAVARLQNVMDLFGG